MRRIFWAVHFLNLPLPEERETITQIFHSFLARESLPDVHETVGLRVDGSKFPCEVSATLIDLPGEPAALVYLSDITDRKLSAEKLHYMGTHDSLTGLYNRAYFDAVLDQGADHAARPISILMLDMNGLKRVNDTCGHAVGDDLIKHSANVLIRAMRGEDIVARIGGDEFAVIMPATDQEAAQKVMGRIQSAVQSHNETYQDHQPISLAIGCATQGSEESLVQTVKKADEAMYVHKRRGKYNG